MVWCGFPPALLALQPEKSQEARREMRDSAESKKQVIAEES